MAVVQSVPDDEIADELAGAWAGDPDEPPPPPPVRPGGRPAGRASAPLARRRPADLRQAAERVRPLALAHEQVLPLDPVFASLLPGGLPRGSAVVVASARAAESGRPARRGATALALVLSSAASASGSWVAAVGLPGLGLGAAAELGVVLERLVVVEAPPAEQWGTVVGALVGAFDIVLLGDAGRVRAAEVRRLAARSRERGSVLIQLDGPAPPPERRRAGIPGFDADLCLTVEAARWQGLEDGYGRLRGRRVTVEAGGRRAASRVRRD
jgi:hypothetical protein